MIPKLHYLSQGTTMEQQLEHIQKACSAGIELVQLDLSAVDRKEHLSLAQEAQRITAHFQTRLVIKSLYKLAKDLKVDGVYLESGDACPELVRDHLYSWQSIGAVAHNAEDCKTLITKNVDYITLGPYEAGKNTNVSLGRKDYKAILKHLETKTPVLAYGDINVKDVPEIIASGIDGLLIHNTITNDFNVIKKFHELLNASSTQEQRHSFN